jgi:hypothetical protein
MQRIQVQNHTASGGFWFAAWLFTLGFLHLDFWRAVFAIVIWPFYLGAHFGH